MWEKEHDRCHGSRGWNSALGRRSRVRGSVVGPFSHVAILLSCVVSSEFKQRVSLQCIFILNCIIPKYGGVVEFSQFPVLIVPCSFLLSLVLRFLLVWPCRNVAIASRTCPFPSFVHALHYAFLLGLPVCMYTYVRTHVRMYVHTYVRTHVCMYVHMYIHTYVRTHICTYTRTYTHMYVWLLVPMYVCVCMYLCTYVCTVYICGHMYVCMYIWIIVWWLCNHREALCNHHTIFNI